MSKLSHSCRCGGAMTFLLLLFCLLQSGTCSFVMQDLHGRLATEPAVHAAQRKTFAKVPPPAHAVKHESKVHHKHKMAQFNSLQMTHNLKHGHDGIHKSNLPNATSALRSSQHPHLPTSANGKHASPPSPSSGVNISKVHAAPHQYAISPKRSSTHKAAGATHSASVDPHSQIILKKLSGGGKSSSRMKELDNAFVLKLLQGSRFTVRTHGNRLEHRSGHQTEGAAAQKSNHSVAAVHKQQLFENMECYRVVTVSTELPKDLKCPQRCPLMVKDKFDNNFCSFQCVGGTTEDCRAANPKTTVADLKKGICRDCSVQGCVTCIHDGTDTCSECASGYQLVGGKCHSQFAFVWYAFFGSLALAVLFICAWVFVLYSRPITNPATLSHALEVRSRTKLHQPLHFGEEDHGVDGVPTADGRSRKLWPLTTNLCRTNVAGVGLTLSFNFQAALIIWASVLALVWAITGLNVEYPTLFEMGTLRSTTPWQDCWIVQWGYAAQQRLMWTKVGYLMFAYLFTFLGCIILGIHQLRLSSSMDEGHSTHKDFCATITGLPCLIGSVHVEEEIKKTIEDASGQRVVGVSVCWDMADKESVLMQVIESELDKRDTNLHGQYLSGSDSPRQGFLVKFFNKLEAIFLSPTTQRILTKKSIHQSLPQRHSVKVTRPDPKDEETGHVLVLDPILELHKLQTTSQAFIVFETEIARDDAMEIMREGVHFRGVKLDVEATSVEPDSVVWGHMHNKSFKGKAIDISWGVCVILAALAVWTICFYLPYVWVTLGSTYAHGQEPSFLSSFTFGMIVCAGNVLMYVVCGEVADRIEFCYATSRELCYMGLYLFACFVNVGLDMVCAYFVAYQAMVGIGMKTHDGTPLADVQSFPERFETYAMQREIGKTLLSYSMPSTFLVPFLIEPFATIYVPFKIMVAIVRTKPEIQGVTAESYLKPLGMDLSRYADILLNAMLAVLILFFPGGFNLTMFIGLAVSHIYIYVFDHYRVLRAVSACQFAGYNVDWWAQWVMCIPCATILMCFMYKSNCEDATELFVHKHIGVHCDHGSSLVLKCVVAFVAHIIVHTVALLFFVPCFGRRNKEPQRELYEHCARRIPISWFSGNPVHCLRSQFIYDHSPPCDYSMLGKQHLVRVNSRIGCYFTEKEADAEDFTEPSIADVGQMMSRKATETVNRFTTGFSRRSSSSSSAQGNSPGPNVRSDQDTKDK